MQATLTPDGIRGRKSRKNIRGRNRGYSFRRYLIVHDIGDDREEPLYKNDAEFSGQDIKYMLMFGGINENTLLYDRGDDELVYVRSTRVENRTMEVYELKLYSLDDKEQEIPR